MGWEDTFRPLVFEAFQTGELHLAEPPSWLAGADSLSPNHRFMWHLIRLAAGVDGARQQLLDWFADQARGGHQGPEWLSTTYDVFYVEVWAACYRLAVVHQDRELFAHALRWIRGLLALYEIHREHYGQRRIVAPGCRCGAVTDPRREGIFYRLTGIEPPPGLTAMAAREAWDSPEPWTRAYHLVSELVRSGEWRPERPRMSDLPRLRHQVLVVRRRFGHESLCRLLDGVHGWPQWYVATGGDLGMVVIRRGGPEAKRAGGGPIPEEPPDVEDRLGEARMTWELGPRRPLVGLPRDPLPKPSELAPPPAPEAPPSDLSRLSPVQVFGPSRWGWFLNQNGGELTERLVDWARREAEAGRPQAFRQLEELARHA